MLPNLSVYENEAYPDQTEVNTRTSAESDLNTISAEERSDSYQSDHAGVSVRPEILHCQRIIANAMHHVGYSCPRTFELASRDYLGEKARIPPHSRKTTELLFPALIVEKSTRITPIVRRRIYVRSLRATQNELSQRILKYSRELLHFSVFSLRPTFGSVQSLLKIPWPDYDLY